MPYRQYHTYHESKAIAAQDYSFYALIMAAMRKADDQNLAALRMAFPGVWDVLYARYNAPGGLLNTDPPSVIEAVVEGRYG